MNIFGRAERKIIPEPKFISINNKENYTEYYDERIGKNYKISNLNYPNTRINPEELNNDFTIYEDTGFIFEDYAEFMFEFRLNDTPISEEMSEFNIGKVLVKIEEPTDLFIQTLDVERDKDFNKEELATLSLKGITKNNVDDFLQESLFLIGNYSPSSYTFEYPKIEPFFGENLLNFFADDEDLKLDMIKPNFFDIGTKKYPKLKYIEVLSFYNKGMTMKEEELGFLYFYKVIEYFFLINRKNEFIVNINNYNQDNNIDSFIKNTTKIYRTNEPEYLKLILKSIENSLKPILKSAKENNKISNEKDLNEFSNALYGYRNSIAHGKSDTNLFLKLPSPLSISEINFWNNIVLNISKIIIDKYCFTNIDKS